MVDDGAPLVPPPKQTEPLAQSQPELDRADPALVSPAVPSEPSVSAAAETEAKKTGPTDTPLVDPLSKVEVEADAPLVGPIATSEHPPVSDRAARAAEAATTETGAEQPSEADDADSLASLGPVIIERLEALHQYMTESTGVEQHQATLMQKLHAENVTLRAGELTQALKPLILDLARLHDDVAGVITRGGEELRKAAVIPELILDVLDRHGVVQIKPAAGQPFDGKQHQGVTVVPTGDASLDGTIESVIRLGFIRDGAHLVRPAQVAVYRHTQPPQQPEQSMSDVPMDPEWSRADASASDARSSTEQPERGELG